MTGLDLLRLLSSSRSVVEDETLIRLLCSLNGELCSRILRPEVALRLLHVLPAEGETLRIAESLATEALLSGKSIPPLPLQLMTSFGSLGSAQALESRLDPRSTGIEGSLKRFLAQPNLIRDGTLRNSALQRLEPEGLTGIAHVPLLVARDPAPQQVRPSYVIHSTIALAPGRQRNEVHAPDAHPVVVRALHRLLELVTEDLGARFTWTLDRLAAVVLEADSPIDSFGLPVYVACARLKRGEFVHPAVAFTGCRRGAVLECPAMLQQKVQAAITAGIRLLLVPDGTELQSLSRDSTWPVLVQPLPTSPARALALVSSHLNDEFPVLGRVGSFRPSVHDSRLRMWLGGHGLLEKIGPGCFRAIAPDETEVRLVVCAEPVGRAEQLVYVPSEHVLPARSCGEGLPTQHDSDQPVDWLDPAWRYTWIAYHWIESPTYLRQIVGSPLLEHLGRDPRTRGQRLLQWYKAAVQALAHVASIATPSPDTADRLALVGGRVCLVDPIGPSHSPPQARTEDDRNSSPSSSEGQLGGVGSVVHAIQAASAMFLQLSEASDGVYLPRYFASVLRDNAAPIRPVELSHQRHKSPKDLLVDLAEIEADPPRPPIRKKQVGRWDRMVSSRIVRHPRLVLALAALAISAVYSWAVANTEAARRATAEADSHRNAAEANLQRDRAERKEIERARETARRLARDLDLQAANERDPNRRAALLSAALNVEEEPLRRGLATQAFARAWTRQQIDLTILRPAVDVTWVSTSSFTCALGEIESEAPVDRKAPDVTNVAPQLIILGPGEDLPAQGRKPVAAESVVHFADYGSGFEPLQVPDSPALGLEIVRPSKVLDGTGPLCSATSIGGALRAVENKPGSIQIVETSSGQTRDAFALSEKAHTLAWSESGKLAVATTVEIAVWSSDGVHRHRNAFIVDATFLGDWLVYVTLRGSLMAWSWTTNDLRTLVEQRGDSHVDPEHVPVALRSASTLGRTLVTFSWPDCFPLALTSTDEVIELSRGRDGQQGGVACPSPDGSLVAVLGRGRVSVWRRPEPWSERTLVERLGRARWSPCGTAIAVERRPISFTPMTDTATLVEESERCRTELYSLDKPPARIAGHSPDWIDSETLAVVKGSSIEFERTSGVGSVTVDLGWPILNATWGPGCGLVQVVVPAQALREHGPLWTEDLPDEDYTALLGLEFQEGLLRGRFPDALPPGFTQLRSIGEQGFSLLRNAPTELARRGSEFLLGSSTHYLAIRSSSAGGVTVFGVSSLEGVVALVSRAGSGPPTLAFSDRWGGLIHVTRSVADWPEWACNLSVGPGTIAYAHRGGEYLRIILDLERQARGEKYAIAGFGRVSALACSPSGSCVAAARGARISVVSVTGAVNELPSTSPAAVTALAWLPGSRRLLLAAGAEDGRVMVIAAESGEIRAMFPGHKGAVAELLPDPTGAWLMSRSADGRIFFWSLRELDMESAELRREVHARTGVIVPLH